ncbi:aminotransferase class III [Streptomyces varsoviensis]|uniref:Aminotransferase class III n=1 Tax=Streptomyces varsoviensis TaxID=67373 RepID=A0ABR5IT40_9ACTN|nr:aminotransferase class III [Streptomyces varsoviensis]
MTPPSRLLAARQPLPSLPFDHAEGCWLYGPDGRRFMDASSGLICVNVGHAHPAVLRALTTQAGKGTFASPGSLDPRLQEAVGRPEDRVAFACTGTAAVEMAIALARSVQRARGEKRRHKVLTASLSYHGNSALNLALSGHRRRRPHPDDGFGLGPAFDPPYPGHHRGCRLDACDATCAAEVGTAIEEAGTDTVAAVLVEPVNGTTGGGYCPPDGYLRALRDICAAHGVLVIHDEVLTGLGRTGLPLAAHQCPASDADLTVLAKGLGAGYLPISAVLIAPDAAEELLSSGSPLPLMGTMSATPLQAAVGMATLSVLDDIGALDRESARGATVTDAVREAARGLPVVTGTRGRGYFLGVELAPGTQRRALAISREQGLLLYPFNGFQPDGGGEGVIVAPPLNISDEETAFLGSALRATFEQLASETTSTDRTRGAA